MLCNPIHSAVVLMVIKICERILEENFSSVPLSRDSDCQSMMKQGIISAQMTLVFKQSQEWEEVPGDTHCWARIAAGGSSQHTSVLNKAWIRDHDHLPGLL